MRLFLKVAVVLSFPAACEPVAGQPSRYAARMADGKLIESDRLLNWHDASALPQLGGTALLDSKNPVMWLRPRERKMSAAPPAYLEFTNGDRLPGAISGFEDAESGGMPHLVVHVATQFEPPLNRPVREIRVLPQFVRRVVWQASEGPPLAPATARFHDGRMLAFRAIRFHKTAVQLLTDEGDRRVEFNSLAELHLPAVDAWMAWFDHVAGVCPTPRTRLLQAETTAGLVATASVDRFAARFEGNSVDPDRWVHGLAPAWSLDILWIPFREIAVYRTFLPTEVPISRLPLRARRGGEMLNASQVRVDRSTHGTPLKNAQEEFGWGLVTSGEAELEYDLPVGARAFRTDVGLDEAVGRGGCVRPEVIVCDSAKDRSLWKGPIVIGNKEVVHTGWLPLPSGRLSSARLLLRIDPVILNRPLGADPLEIRDFALWGDPLLKLDEAALRDELYKRMSSRVLAWRGWNVEWDGNEDAGYELSWHRDDRIPGAFEPAIRCMGRPFVLTREVSAANDKQWLVIDVARRSPKLPEPKMEVRIDGQVVAAFVPSYVGPGAGSEPALISLASYVNNGQPLVTEIRQVGAAGSPAVLYRRLTVSERPSNNGKAVTQNSERANR